MGRTQTGGVERSVEMPVSTKPDDGRASPFLGAALSPAGRQTVLDALGDAWARNPELRLCELVIKAAGRSVELNAFYVEDGELLALLREYPAVGA